MSEVEFKVDFFCVGVAKAGTTTLHDLLNLQPNISLPDRKETNYFSFGINGKPEFCGPLDSSSVNDRTVTSFQQYVKEFTRHDGATYGEICPSYVLPGSADNIYAHNPAAKIIIILREPVSRSYSNYQHLVRDGRESNSFEDALACESERLSSGWEWFWGLKNNSLYYSVTKEYLDLFGKENVKIIFFEDFVKKQHQYLREVLEFLELDSSEAVFAELDSNKSGVVASQWKYLHRILLAEGVFNSFLRVVLPPGLRKILGDTFKRLSTVKGSVSSETRLILSREFSDDLMKLNQLIDGKVTHWLEKTNVS